MRWFARFSLLLLPLLLFCGRGEDYKDATLQQAMSGEVRSSTNSYRIADPTVEVVEGDYALLREGGEVHILAADDFETLWPELEGEDFVLLVKKWPNPYPHLRLYGYVMNEEEHETDWVLAESELPLLVDHPLYDTSLFERIERGAWEESVPRDVVDRKIWIRAAVESEPVEPEEGEEETAEADASPTGTAEAATTTEPAPLEEGDVFRHARVDPNEEGPEDRFLLQVGARRFELPPIEEDGVKLLLKGHEAAGNTFGVGGYVAELYPKRRAEETGLAGTFQLEIFDFGGKYVLQR